MSRKCAICGCTSFQACREGCSWFRGSNVCDSCVQGALEDVADSFNQEMPQRISAITKVQNILKHL